MVEEFRVPRSTVEVSEETGGIEGALKRLEWGCSSVRKELKKRKFFLSPSQKDRLKHREAVKKSCRKFYFYLEKQKRDPKVEFTERQYEEIKALSNASESLTAGASESEATALMIIKRNKKFLTVEDIAKDGKLGFVTGGINKGESVPGAAAREINEESGLTADAEKISPVFSELNVSRSSRPYIMKGVFIKEVSGKLIAGEEIVPGSLKWRTPAEIDDLIMSGMFVSNHVHFWNKFCEIYPKEVEYNV